MDFLLKSKPSSCMFLNHSNKSFMAFESSKSLILNLLIKGLLSRSSSKARTNSTACSFSFPGMSFSCSLDMVSTSFDIFAKASTRGCVSCHLSISGPNKSIPWKITLDALSVTSISMNSDSQPDSCTMV